MRAADLVQLKHFHDDSEMSWKNTGDDIQFNYNPLSFRMTK